MPRDRPVDLGRMCQRAHMAGACDDRETGGGHECRQRLCNQARWRGRMLAAHDQRGNAQTDVCTCGCRLIDQRAKIERCFGRPARQRGLHGWPQRGPCVPSAPVIDKRNCCSAIVAADHPVSSFGGDCQDFRKRGSPAGVHRLEEMEGRWLIESEAGDTVRPLDSRAQRDTAAIGVADEVHFATGAIDDLDGPGCLVRESEGVFTTPRTRAVAAIMLGCDQLIA